MNTFDQLEKYCRRITEISDEEWIAFYSKFEVVHLKKNEYYTKFGEQEDYVYFLNSGIVRVYTTKEDKEHSAFFFFENSFFSSTENLIANQPSLLGCHSITDTESVRIHKKDLFDLFDQYKSIDRLGRLVIEENRSNLLDQYLDLLCMTAETRYEKLFEKHAQLVLNIPVKYLASFLGVHQNSLSRIRSKI